MRKQLSQLQPLNNEIQQRLHKKFRLEWNYNSNHIEGNTLTYGETELLLIFDQTKGNHGLREYEEMKGHDVALKLIYDLASNNERQLTEKFIREINEILLVRPFYKDAETLDGQPTKRLIKIGDYKSFPNSVRLQNGEIFHYPSPAQTPAMMHDLMNWYHEASKDKNIEPVEVAAELHYKFVCIHPFDDGNGRISRLLMNYHLLKNDCPPIIIKSTDKKNYLFALHEADTGNIEAFKTYIATQLIWSYDISIKASKGESIDEVGDWKKKIHLLNQETPPALELQMKKSPEVLYQVFNTTILSLIDLMLNKWAAINDLFFNRSVQINMQPYGITSALEDFQYIKNMFIQLNTDYNSLPSQVSINYSLLGFKKNGKNAFDLNFEFVIFFEDFFYAITIKPSTSYIRFEKFYHQSLTKEEEEIIANAITEFIISTYEGNKTTAS